MFRAAVAVEVRAAEWEGWDRRVGEWAVRGDRRRAELEALGDLGARWVVRLVRRTFVIRDRQEPKSLAFAKRA